MGEIRVGSPAAVGRAKRPEAPGKVGVNWVKHAGRGPSNYHEVSKERNASACTHRLRKLVFGLKQIGDPPSDSKYDRTKGAGYVAECDGQYGSAATSASPSCSSRPPVRSAPLS